MPPKRARTAKAKGAAATSKAAADDNKAEDVPVEEEAPKEEQVAEQDPTPVTKSSNEDEHAEEVNPEAPAETKQETKGKKRKQAASSDEPQKAPRRSGRSAPKSQPSQLQLLNYVLSKDAEELCRPDDETEYLKEHPKNRTYSSSPLNPFEELLCAVILSRPISHRLGLRTIRTVLNDPYNFTSAKAVQAAGSEKRLKAVYDARTQHKDKTAAQMGDIADVVLERFTNDDDKEGKMLQKVRDMCDKDIDKEMALLKENINGLGKTGLDIFFRRVQWIWDAAYMFMDEKSLHGLKKLGLPDDGQELNDLFDEHWSSIDKSNLVGKTDEEKKKRAFVTVLERATGADLEGKIDALLEAAAAAAS